MKNRIKKNRIQVRNARRNPYMDSYYSRLYHKDECLNSSDEDKKPLPNWNKEETEIGSSNKSLILCGNIVSSEDDALDSIAFYIKSCNNFLQLFESGTLQNKITPGALYKKVKNAIKCNSGGCEGFRNDMTYRESRLADWIKLYNTEEGKESGYVYLNLDNNSSNPYSAKISGKQYMESLDKVLSKEKYPISAIEIEACYEENTVNFLYGEAYILNLDIDEYMLIAFSLDAFKNEDTITHIYFPSILAETDTLPNEEDVDLEDCGSMNLIKTNLPNMEVLERLNGKNILLETGELHMIDSEKDLWLIGDTVQLRSEITCLNSRTICKVCRGKIKDEEE